MKHAPPKLDLTISATTAAGRPHAATLRRYLPRACGILNPPLRELSVALVGDARMADLHERFLGIRGPTDVLTFELEHDDRGRVTAGEVVVCVPEAVRQGKVRRTSAARELLLYALHGLLHLCGFDDRTARGFAAMHRTEDEILTRLGVGPVFGIKPPAAPRRKAAAPGRATAAARRRPSRRRRRTGAS